MNTKKGVETNFTLHHELRGYKRDINRIAWSPNGNILAVPSDDQLIHLWDMQTEQNLRHLKGHTGGVISVAWSPDGRMLASGSYDKTICLWDTQIGQLLQTLTKHEDVVSCVAWSSGGILASGSDDQTVRIWNTQAKTARTLTGHSDWIISIAWSPDGRLLASGSGDRTIRLWNTQTNKTIRTLTDHSEAVMSLAWSPDGRLLASGSGDRTICIWDIKAAQHVRTLEGHTSTVTSVSFNYDGRLLASKSDDNTIRFWHTGTWETVAILEAPVSESWTSNLTFHPNKHILAALDENDTIIRIWDLDTTTLLRNSLTADSIHYTNAKVVLMGDSGTGKTGLSLVLTKQPFVPTESTHGRHVWTFDIKKVKFADGRKETHETLLWDLAGQPGYRLVHQLHLNDVAVALVVFDSRSETDPFAGVAHWVRALRTAERVQGNTTLVPRKYLVAARVDRGGSSVSHKRTEALIHELALDGYFETSAKEGFNIAALTRAIKRAIDWDVLPKVTSTVLFQRIKAFLLSEKEAGRLLATFNSLYHMFLKSFPDLSETRDLSLQFETCIGRMESQGLIRRLSFGDLVLLQPELLDTYASALINSIRDEPDGLGSIIEERIRTGDFFIPKDERLKDKEQEKLLLIAMIEDLLRYEIALREQSEDGPFIVFPSQSTRENPSLPNPEGKAVVVGFEGPIQNIYATLAVRLSHSGLFKKEGLWKNAVTYTAKVGGRYGIYLHNVGEGCGELTLFFDERSSEETRFHFEEYVLTHLQRRALPESIKRRRIFICNECGCIVTEQTVRLRLERGFNWLNCPVCDTKVFLLDREERLAVTPTSLVAKMDRTADRRRDRDVTASILQGRSEVGDFDVFLCYNVKDRSKIKEIGEKLKENRILPWLDEWELRPGLPWQRLLEAQMKQIKSVAIFVGKDGIGPWQQMEIEAFLRKFVMQGCPVIPALLADAPHKPQLPIFLESMTWVDFREPDTDPMERLIWGITGKKFKPNRIG